MIISPVMKFIVDKEVGYPAPTEKEKLDRAIGKFRRILGNLTGTFNIAETKFGLADMLVGRNSPGDHQEAVRLYNFILDVAPTSYLRARALVGRAELLIDSSDRKVLDEAVSLCERAIGILKDDMSDFFTAKAFAVLAEILAKLSPEGRKKAGKYFEKIIKHKEANPYFRARAMVGRAELPLYSLKSKDLAPAIKYCSEAQKLLEDRGSDYFLLKAKVVQAELLIRRARKDDLKSAQDLCAKVISVKSAERGLLARAKLDLAEISRHPKAEKLYREVLEMEGIDPYLIDKAKAIEKAIKKPKKSK